MTRIYNTGSVELVAGTIMMLVFFYLYEFVTTLMIDASTLGTTVEENALRVASITLFLILCGFLICGTVLFRYGFTTFVYFIIDAYNNVKDGEWL